MESYIKKIIAVVDIETSAFVPEKGYIVEIGVCELDFLTGKITKLFNEIVREDNFGEDQKEAWIFKNSDLKYEEILKAKLLTEFKDELQEIFNYYPVVAYNKQFDFRFLRDCGFKIKNELSDPMKLAVGIVKGLRKNKWPSVIEAYKHFCKEEEYLEEHRGYQDCFDEAKMIYAMYKSGIVFKIYKDGKEIEKI